MIISKTYKLIGNSCRKLTMYLGTPYGRTIEVCFYGGDAYLNTNGTYSTRNYDIQKMLESHPDYGKKFVLESQKLIESPEEIKAREEAAKKKEPVLKTVKFSSVKACQTYFDQTLHIKAYPYNTQQKCIDKGKEFGLNVVFE